MPDIHDLPRRVPLPLSVYDRIAKKSRRSGGKKRPDHPKKSGRSA